MAIALSESQSGSGASVSSIAATSWTPAANDLVVVSVVSRNTTATHDSVTGNGITFTKQEAKDGSTSLRSSIWTGQNASPSAGQITATFSASVLGCAIIVARFSGVNTSTPVEVVATGATATDANPTISVTTLTNNAWVVGHCATRVDALFTAADTDIVHDINGGATGDKVYLSMEYGIQATAGSFTLNGTLSSSARVWTMEAVVLKPAATAGSFPPLPEESFIFYLPHYRM